MCNVGSGVMGAGVTVAFIIYGRKLPLIFCIAYIDSTISGKYRAGPSLTTWGNAVEGICSVFNSDKKIIGLTYSKQVTWLIAGEFLAHPSNYGSEFFFV